MIRLIQITLKVYITSEYNTNGTISIPLQGWTQAFSVSANQGIVIKVPTDLAYSDNNEIIEQKGIHIIADNNISVWAINNAMYSTDGTNVLPTCNNRRNPGIYSSLIFWTC